MALIYKLAISTCADYVSSYPFNPDGPPPPAELALRYEQVDLQRVTHSKGAFLLVCGSWYTAGLSIFWETVYLHARWPEPIPYRTVLSNVMRTIRQSARDSSTTGGFGRFVKRLVFDLDDCPKEQVFKLVRSCPNLQLLTVHENDTWGLDSQPLGLFPPTLRRLNWFPSVKSLVGSPRPNLHPDLSRLSASLNTHPHVVSLCLPRFLALAMPVSFHHIVCFELYAPFHAIPSLITSLSLPSLKRLVIKNPCATAHLIPFIQKFCHQLTHLTLESCDHEGLVVTFKSALLVCQNLEQLGLHFEELLNPPQIAIPTLTPNATIKLLILQCIPMPEISDLLKRIISIDWKSLEVVRLVPSSDIWEHQQVRTEVASAVRARFLSKNVALEDWMGRSLLCGGLSECGDELP